MNAKILVVDDEADLVDLVAYNLRRRGHSVATATSGQEGIARVRQERPDLIVVDLALPDIDAGALCDLLRQERASETIPVLLFSCLGSSGMLALPGARNPAPRQASQLRILLDQIDEMLAARQLSGEPGGRRLMSML